MESGDGGAAGGATLLFLLQAVAADGGRAENIADVNYEDSPGNVLVDFFGRMRVFHFAALTTICAVVIVSGFSVLFHGEVLADYAFTGGTTAILLTIPVVSALLGRQHRLEREIAQREEVERANAALIARLERSLEVERELAAMKLREEKLRTLRMTMSKVLHHVNNLANNLQIVEPFLSLGGGRSVSPVENSRHPTSFNEVLLYCAVAFTLWCGSVATGAAGQWRMKG